MLDYRKYITSHDIMKIVAIVSMIMDHYGLFLSDYGELWRIMGRISFPIFAFLIGYSGKYNRFTDLITVLVIHKLFVCCILNYASIDHVLKDTIIPALILARLAILFYDKVIAAPSWIVFALLIISMPILQPIFQYGSFGIIFALCGYYKRNYENVSEFLFCSCVLYLLYASFLIQEETWHYVLLVFLIALIFLCFDFYQISYLFRIKEDSHICIFMKLISSNSLYIYVVHYELFRIISNL